MRFAKYHGTGNDFVLIEDLDDRVRLEPGQVAAICDRHRGVGADGVIRIAAAAGAHFFMDYLNADGSVAEMCGNGIRCLAKYVFDRGLTRDETFDVGTRAGVKRLTLQTSGATMRTASVDMGPPRLRRADIPMVGRADDTFVQQPLEVDGRRYLATAVSMGNPHVVVFLDGDSVEGFPVRTVGPRIEHLPMFPVGTNVEFVHPMGDRLEARVWERGSGETLACGTGACAVGVAAAVAGLAPRRAVVEFPGGPLEIQWAEDDHVILTGPATHVFDGELALEPVSAEAAAW